MESVAMSGSSPVGVRDVLGGEESFDSVSLSVGVHDADIRVPAWRPVQPRKDAEEMRKQDPVHATVADDQDRLARALAGEALDRAKRPRKHLFERFTAGPGDEAVVVPARQALGLVEGLPGPVTDIDLTELRHDFDLDPVRLRDDLSGMTGTREIARDDAVELHFRELLSDHVR